MSVLSPGFLGVITAVFYLLASVFYGAGTLRGDSPERRRLLRYGLVSAITGALFHTAAIGLRCVTTHTMPLVSAPDMLSAVGWAIVLAFLLLQACPLRDRMIALGALGMPFAFLSVFAGSAIRHSRHSPSVRSHALNGNLVSLHVLAIVFAFGFLALAVASACLYLLEDRMLKRKQVAQLLFWKLPPLTTIDNLAFTLVSLAFPLLTVGILAGIIRAVAEGDRLPTWGLEPHTLASVVTWAVYGAYLWLHVGKSWRGPRANSLLLVGLLAALVTYFIPGTLHQFS